ncbi:hypothetical protein O3G_MSEX013789 [Manduca sexta]|uniref:Uncharacterized protein n=1 Tax=Manduca sexta TaxID=7130 RepID=A0A921ZU82_MANSE|nr:hypothetical protein O3G_MSEX013789 [Manduca sexta]KAG6463298.1 hypothetical protein O3G_MSEX013789 [Manduca sexta]
MTSVLVPILVFSIVFNLVVYTSAAPTLIQDILDVFGNPFKDFKKSILQETEVNATYVEDNLTTKPPDNSAGKMIDVPLNHSACSQGTYLDSSGVCRQPWQ